ncbi:MAG: TonB-dependent receptor [Gammaproteobacteria bacterium]|nr:TonB-dependent receptor [Gammaproteobacteria bacterium]
MNANRYPQHSADARRRLRLLTLSMPAAACAAILATDQAAGQQLEEVVVTARFREESLQQTPLAISALTAETLEANGATNVIDVADWAPNVVIDQLGSGWGPTIAANIRGLGYADFKPTNEQTVTIYIDDVVLGRPTGALLDLLDLERVEVLRGPQGTLFGKNAIGGVVRLITRKPGEGDQGGNVEVTVGQYDRLDVRGSFETTLVEDKLFTRVSYASKQRDGWQDNVDFRCYMIERGTPELAGINDGVVGWDTATNTPIMGVVGSPEDNAFALPTRTSERGTDRNCVVGRFGDENVRAARGTLRYVPSDSFEVSVAADITDQKSTSPYDYLEAANPNTGLGTLYNNAVALPNWGVPWDERFVPGDESINFSGFNANSGIDGGIETPNINDFDHWGLSSTFDWALDDVGVKLILAHREFDAQWGRDSDASPMPMNHTLDTFRNEQDTAEIRVSGQMFGGRTDWTVGGFWFDSSDFNSNISVLMPCLFPTACIDRVDTVDVRNTGIFFNTVTQLTDRLSLTLGLRNSDDEKEILQVRYDRQGNLCCGFESPALVVAESSETDPMVSLSYDVNDNVMVYGTYQEGFRGGGTTPRPTGTTRVPFGPETLANFEIGVKSDLLDRRLRLNASIFDMTYEDLQQGAAGQDELGQPAWLTVNAGEAEIQGLELELQSTIGERWLLDFALGHIDFQMVDLGAASPEAREELGLDPEGAADISDVPGRTPRYTASVNAGYTAPLSNGSQIVVRYGISYQDETFFGNDQTNPLERAPSYSLHNARITWISSDESWEASLFGTNITDERAIQSKLNFLNLFGSLQTTFVRPEEWAMSIRKRF